ncbi:uncharacterized protein LOC133709707 isoform X2 [Rosa rugosa]|uniref:uncharacterized protein LOC133709707 isoform X2 n=1 Tax=Rosa rugosa TaxID=74645 RepID=UPI002B404285|nr:uncharacterized protein LOC133709707 isoform X2 [Rosa rugosa]
MNYSLQQSGPVMNHDMVCPNVVEPLFKQMVNKFIDDHAQPEDKENKGSCKILARNNKQLLLQHMQIVLNLPQALRKMHEIKYHTCACICI